MHLRLLPFDEWLLIINNWAESSTENDRRKPGRRAFLRLENSQVYWHLV
jgi:hypothetical protein